MTFHIIISPHSFMDASSCGYFREFFFFQKITSLSPRAEDARKQRGLDDKNKQSIYKAIFVTKGTFRHFCFKFTVNRNNFHWLNSVFSSAWCCFDFFTKKNKNRNSLIGNVKALHAKWKCLGNLIGNYNEFMPFDP